MMQIFVKTLTGKTITLQVELSDIVNDVKAKIEEKEGIPICHQTLVYGNKILAADKKSLSFYGVSNEATLEMLLRWNSSVKIENVPTDTPNEDNFINQENPDNETEGFGNNNDKNDACEKFQDKLIKSMTFEMNREVENRTKSFRKLEDKRIAIDSKVSELNMKRDGNMLEYQERKECHKRSHRALWDDQLETLNKKTLMDHKIKEMQDESAELELKVRENAEVRRAGAEQHLLDTRLTNDENNKIEEEIGMLKRKQVHIENEKNVLFKKKKVNEGLVDFISNTIEEKMKDVSCPVCFETAETPIYMCSMAHLICKNCLPRLKICPECRKQYPKPPVRHRFAEKLDDEIRKLTMERKTLLDGESFSGDQNIENLQEMRLRQRQLAKIQEDFNMSPESDSEDDGEENNEDGSQPPADLSPV